MRQAAAVILFSLHLICLSDHRCVAEEVIVRDSKELAAAIRDLRPGTILRIGPGEYKGGLYVQGVDQLTIEALDEKQPPHFKGGSNAWHFSQCNQLTLRHLRTSGQTGNGLNLDDGGNSNPRVMDVTLDSVRIDDVGPRGNYDGIKCSGLERLSIKDCVISGWGGQGIDMVGCHNVSIQGCRFIGKPGFTATAGIQAKGGCADVIIEKCDFQDAGERPLNIGGSTGLSLFRPDGAKFEAKNIVARENVIRGSQCAVAFVGVDGAEFESNTILFPQKWIFRILQETSAEGFAPCQNVVVKDNKIVFRRSDIQIEVNIGGGTKAETFQFIGNRWFAEDQPDKSRPKLPVAETEATYGSDPR